MSKWHRSYNMSNLNDKLDWGMYQNHSLWDVVLRDPKYIKWLMQNSSVSFSDMLRVFLVGAISVDSIEKRELYYRGTYNTLLNAEKEQSERLREQEKQRAREKKQKEALLKKQKVEETIACNIVQEQMTRCLSDIDTLLELARSGQVKWVKQQGSLIGNMKREKYITSYQSREVILHRESYKGKDYKWVSRCFFTYEIHKKPYEVKPSGISKLWKYLDDLDAEAQAKILHAKKEEKMREAERKSKLPRKEIEFADFVVKCNTIACESNHVVEDIIAVFMITKNNVFREIEVPAGYCKDCDCYFILEETYKEIKDKGRLLCQLITVTIFEKMKMGQLSYIDGWADESPLKIAGYNVNAKANLSEWERRTILEYIVDSGILTKNRVLQYLDYFIGFREHRTDMQDAIEKWKADRKYIASYRKGSKKHVKVGSLTVKTKIRI